MPRGAALAAALLAAAAAAASPRAADALVPRQRAPDFTATGKGGGELLLCCFGPPWPPIAAPAAPNATLRGNPDAQSLNSRGMRLAFPSVRPRPDTRLGSGELGGALFQHARQPRPARLLGGSLLLPIRFHLRCVRARRAQREAPPAAKKK